MQKWITKELLNYLPIEDEILVSMVFNWLEASVYIYNIIIKIERWKCNSRSKRITITNHWVFRKKIR